MTTRYHSDIITKLANSNQLPLINTSLINNKISNDGKKRFDNIINSITNQWRDPNENTKEEKFQQPIVKEKYNFPKFSFDEEEIEKPKHEEIKYVQLPPPPMHHPEPKHKQKSSEDITCKIILIIIVLLLLVFGFVYLHYLQRSVNYLAYLETGIA